MSVLLFSWKVFSGMDSTLGKTYCAVRYGTECDHTVDLWAVEDMRCEWGEQFPALETLKQRGRLYRRSSSFNIVARSGRNEVMKEIYNNERSHTFCTPKSVTLIKKVHVYLWISVATCGYLTQFWNSFPVEHATIFHPHHWHAMFPLAVFYSNNKGNNVMTTIVMLDTFWMGKGGGGRDGRVG